MPSLELMMAFLAATLLFAYVPGPAMIYATAQTMAGGKRSGWLAALGIHIGGYVHVLAAALGLAMLFEVVPSLYLALKIAGAIYLIWMGLKLVFKKVLLENKPSVASQRAFWESIVVEVLNPKTAIFFVAFLPQFTDPSAGLSIGLQLFILGTIVNIIFSSADILCVLLADRISIFLRNSSRTGQILPKIAGGFLLALGLNVAVSK